MEQDIYMVLRVFLTNCISSKGKKKYLYSGEIGQCLDWAIKITITNEGHMDTI